ncbi:thioredoxin domain-containing protein [Psychroflexus montanilacus]|uniref:thioredoxin domain-containing protein n=1 Tax=Psychroflexus montanilacus TaxID=2873598 RepID=UPI001CCE4F14|nr:thioredoxin domain-containing protein [Psychroflexus montanilacus]MBZ9651668.1 thioredoxin domain-containing protein [Psychroflexus montanilacus]
MAHKENDLQYATSPYLLQHASNPVHWEEWSPEVLERAKKEGKPLLISIGYAACHWCHVMAHESFEDKKVAELMNAHFVCIKIDREERPDIDHIYMEAAQMLTGRGGWPLNAFALPDGRPFYAATYFPKDNWKKVLSNVARAYSNSYEQLLDTAEKLTEGIQLSQELSHVEEKNIFKNSNYRDFIMNWQKMVDLENGGFKGAPKFPMANSWQFLLQYYQKTEDHFAAEALTKTLDEIALGGIYDQIGGGFSRYSVDDKWFAPHFEKMLYDNALLLNLYANTFKLLPKPLYKKVISETVEFTKRELIHPEAGFYSALDADSEGEEGKYYVWTFSELSELLSEKELKLIEEYYNISKRGNWETSKNILFAQQSPQEYAKSQDLDSVSFELDLQNLKDKLHQYRQKRIRPALDDKIITSWNAMMVSGLVQAYTALHDKEHLDLAESTIEFLLKSRFPDRKKLLRTYKNGKSITGFLEDYAFTVEALIQLYQVTFKIEYLESAKQLAEICFKEFKEDASPMFQYTSKHGEQLISKTYEINDNVIPASNSSLAKSLFLLGKFYNNEHYIDTSKKMLQQVESKLYKSGPYFANWQILYGWMTFPFYEVAIMGDKAQAKALELQSNFQSNCIFLGGQAENLELLNHKLPKYPDETLIYVCENKTCQQPTTHVETAKQQLKSQKH